MSLGVIALCLHFADVKAMRDVWTREDAGMGGEGELCGGATPTRSRLHDRLPCALWRSCRAELPWAELAEMKTCTTDVWKSHAGKLLSRSAT